jgi:malate dehydrogenase
LKTIAILGAGELGATLARILADREAARRILLVDEDEGRAKGKALDIRHAGPIEGSDTDVQGRAALDEECDLVVVADAAHLGSSAQARLFVAAGLDGSSAVAAAVERGWKRERALGSAPIAFTAAFRRALAAELRVEAREISGLVIGAPPVTPVVPASAVRVGGIPSERLSSIALRRAIESIRARALGPVALASGAARLIAALASARESVLPVVARLDGEYGHRGLALAVPGRISCYGLEGIIECDFDPVDRVAFDTAAQRRYNRPDPA